MSISKRTFYLVICPCVVIVLLAVAMRHYTSPKPKAKSPAWPAASSTDMPLYTESDFFQMPGSSSGKVNPFKESTPAGPVVSARAYLVGNVETGQIYTEHNEKLVLPVASMSKLITAFTATDQYSATTSVIISEANANVASDTSHIAAGEKYSLQEILYPLLLNSSNVAAEAIASIGNRTDFLESMSGYAWEVGMPSTFFADPSGIDPKNISTASDFFNLAKYLYKSRTDILAITRTPHESVATTTDHGAHDFNSIHPFVNDPDFLGGKTGHTPEAHDTMLTIMNIGDQPVAFIVLASDNRAADTRLLISQLRNKIGLGN